MIKILTVRNRYGLMTKNAIFGLRFLCPFLADLYEKNLAALQLMHIDLSQEKKFFPLKKPVVFL